MSLELDILLRAKCNLRGERWRCFCCDVSFSRPPPNPPNKNERTVEVKVLPWLSWVILHPLRGKFQLRWGVGCEVGLLLEVGRSPICFFQLSHRTETMQQKSFHRSNQWKCSGKIFWVVVSNIVYFSPRPMEMIQFEWYCFKWVETTN